MTFGEDERRESGVENELEVVKELSLGSKVDAIQYERAAKRGTQQLSLEGYVNYERSVTSFQCSCKSNGWWSIHLKAVQIRKVVWFPPPTRNGEQQERCVVHTVWIKHAYSIFETAKTERWSHT